MGGLQMWASAPRVRPGRVTKGPGIVGHLDPGIPVNGTRQGVDALWQVSRTDNGQKLGYMRPADLTCDSG